MCYLCVYNKPEKGEEKAEEEEEEEEEKKEVESKGLFFQRS